MENNDLVSVIRLPNNLFTDYAGTEVGGDLIILQKNTAKQNLNEMEELFCQSTKTEYGTPSNALLDENEKIVHTHWKVDTDPYGQPALIYTHDKGVEGIADSLKQMLSDDFGKHLNLSLYRGERNDEPIVQIPIKPIVTPPVIEREIKEREIIQPEQPRFTQSAIIQESPQELKQLSIFDLFENDDESVAVLAPPKKATQTKKQTAKKQRANIGRQTDLFSSTMQQPYTAPVSNGSVKRTIPSNGTKQEAIGDLFSQSNENGQADKPAISVPVLATIPEPAPYSGELQSFHRNDCLVVDNGWFLLLIMAG